MRGLYTRTIALRLRSADETRMVLGDGMAALAPADRLSPAAPGSGWVVEDDGSVDRVRADYWPDPLIRDVADTYRPAVLLGVAAGLVDVGEMTATVHAPSNATATTQRAPRAPRLPRASRLPRVPADAADGLTGGEAA